MSMKKILAAVLCVAMVLSTMGLAVMADAVTADLEISTAEQLVDFAAEVNAGANYRGKTVVLTNDIDLAGIAWEPIGTSSNPFKGTFDGQNYTISNLRCERDVEITQRAALFGQANEAKICNIKVNNVYATALARVSAIAAGGTSTTIDNCHVTGDIYFCGYQYVGAIIGYGYIKVSNCSVAGSTENPAVYATPDNDSYGKMYVGGIAGWIGEGNSSITNCTASYIDLTSNGNLGGITGLIHYGNSVTGCSVSNITLSGNSAVQRPGTVGIIAGGNAGTASEPTKLEGNVITDVYATDGEKVIKSASGGNPVDTTTPVVSYVAKTVDEYGATIEYYTSLQEALNMAGAANAGDTTIELLGDIDLSNVDWTPVYVDGYHGADVVTLIGNGYTIYGINAPLFKGGFAGGSAIVISDLTIADSEIVSTNSTGSGAFIEYIDSMEFIVLENCHLINSSVTGSRTGGLIGYTTGYNNVNDGAVYTLVTVRDCSVTGCTITGSSVGAIVGHAGANPWTYTLIENVVIENNDLISTDDGGWRVGVAVGTANVGEIDLNEVTYSGNTLTQGDKTALDGQTDLIGRSVPGTTGKVWIDEVPYGTNLQPSPVRMDVDGIAQGFATLDAALDYAKANAVTQPEIDLYGDVALTEKLAGFEKVTLNGATGEETIAFPESAHYAIGSVVEFNNLVIERSYNIYTGIAHNNGQIYNNCVINGVFFVQSSKSVVFNGCEFNVEGDAYNVWTYGAEEIEFNNCKFYSDGKSLLVYRDGGNTAYGVEVNDCVFYAADSFDGKAAIEIDATAPYEVVINDSSAIGFDEGSKSGDMLWNIKNTNYNTALTTLTVNEKAVDLVDYKANTTNKDEIAVKFVKTDIDGAGNDTNEEEDIYNIVLASDNDINRFNSADLTFVFTPEALADGELKYEIIDVAGDNIHVAPVNNSKTRFEFHFDGKDGVLNDTATDIVIAQVKFTGYGTYSFNVAAAETNAVHATTLANNIVDTYVSEGIVDGEGVLDIENGLAGIVKKVPTRDLTVEITFPNAIEYDNTVAYQDMKVTIVGGNQNIEIDLAAEADYTFTKALPYETAYTVTVSGAGYRTATYTVQLTEDKTLNFWNNVMDRELEVEVKNSTSKTVKNFLAGDIVGDDEINIYDLSAAVSYFGTNTKGDAKYSKYDLNRDGKVDSKDVAFILVSWGE